MMRVVALLFVLMLTACASEPQQAAVIDYPEPVFTPQRILAEDFVSPSHVEDPWRAMNHRIYNFNYHFDQWVFLPVVRGYQTVVPRVARIGVNNFFNNFRDIRTMANSVLQLNPKKFVQSTGRVLVNTTLGLAGFVDVATDAGMPRPDEDFGQTLGYWGVGQGPYLVLPFLGPSNLRDGIGLWPDFYLQTVIQDDLMSKPVRLTAFFFDSIDTRTGTSFRYHESGSAFEYETVRWLWSEKRKLDVAK